MKQRLGRFVAVLLAIAWCATTAVAQSTYVVSIDSNTHVRLVPRDSVAGRVEGRVVRLANDTIVVRDRDALVRRALGDLSGIDVRGGKNRGRGVAYGTAAGLAIAGIGGGIDLGRGDIRSDQFVGLLLGNALVGGIVGYFLAPTGWQRIPIARPTKRE